MAGSILVVDDDLTLAAALRDALIAHDIVIHEAADAPAACLLLEQQRYCGLVLDVVLDAGNGFDVLRHMARQKITVPTIVVTRKLPAYVREMLAEEQVKLVFPKPVDPRLLGAIVLGLCGIATN